MEGVALIDLILINSMDEKNTIIKEVENLCRKADQTRSINNLIRDDIVLINKFFLLYVTIGSAVSAMFIFAVPPEEYQLYVGIFLASVFICSLIPGALGFDSQIVERTLAVQAWGEWVRDAKNFCNVEINQMDSRQMLERQNDLLISYKKVMDKTPLIPDKKFNKYKRLHLQKIAISREISINPFKKIKTIIKELASKDLMQ